MEISGGRRDKKQEQKDPEVIYNFCIVFTSIWILVLEVFYVGIFVR